MNTFFNQEREISKAATHVCSKQMKLVRDAVDKAIHNTDLAANENRQWINMDDHKSLMELWFDLHTVLSQMEVAIKTAPRSDWVYEPTQHTLELQARKAAEADEAA